jgi:hypothetical protein
LKQYIYNVLVGFDMFMNTVFGGLPDETISAHAGRMEKQDSYWAIVLSVFLNWLQPHHVEDAIKGDEQRAETVETLEESSK